MFGSLSRNWSEEQLTHSVSLSFLEEAEELSDRVIVIADGRIVADEDRASLVDEKGRLAPAFRRLTAVTSADNG